MLLFCGHVLGLDATVNSTSVLDIDNHIHFPKRQDFKAVSSVQMGRIQVPFHRIEVVLLCDHEFGLLTKKFRSRHNIYNLQNAL